MLAALHSPFELVQQRTILLRGGPLRHGSNPIALLLCGLPDAQVLEAMHIHARCGRTLPASRRRTKDHGTKDGPRTKNHGPRTRLHRTESRS